MTELSYTKSFLTLLASRPHRLSQDHIEDPRKLPARGPVPLPALLNQALQLTTAPAVHSSAHPPREAEARTHQPQGRRLRYLQLHPHLPDLADSLTVSITIKPLRPTPALSPLVLPDTALATTVTSLKREYAASLGVDVGRLKLLLKGRPLADVKTLGELGFVDGAEGVVTAMLMAGAPAKEVEVKEVETAEAPKLVKALADEKFWEGLGGWLAKRLEGAEEDPKAVLEKFRGAWKE